MNLLSLFSATYEYRLLGIVYLASSLLSFCLGLIVLLHQRESKKNRAFFLITFTGSIWLFSFGWLVMARGNAVAHIWHQLDYIFSVPFISPCVYLFAVRWIGESPRKTFVPHIFGVACIFSLITFLSPNGIVDFGIHEPWGQFNRFKTETRFGLFYISSLLIFFTLVAAAAFKKLWHGYTEASSPSERNQYRNFLIAFIVGYCGSTDFLVALNLFSLPLGAISFGAFTALVAYSIIRYQFLDVNLARRKFLIVFLIYGFLFSILLPPVSYQLHRSIIEHGTDAITSFLFTTILVGAVFSFGPFLYAFLTRRDFWLRTATTTGLAHELKSPIAAISGAIDLLSQQMKTVEGFDALKAYSDIIQRNAERLQSYVGDLLNLAHAADCHLLLKPQPVDLNVIVERVIDHYKSIASHKNVAIKFQGERRLNTVVDPIRIEQVISNLISNAVRVSERGEICVSIKKEQDHFLISVSDQGCGIPRQDLTRVFERFYQVNKRGQGSGIGLTIAKTWVEAHGGKIWAESDGEGKGATVMFTLPV